MMSTNRAFVVVPFQRDGTYIGPQQMLFFTEAAPAKAIAHQLSRKCAGVALIERSVDEETGADVDRLIAAAGAVPSDLISTVNWRMALH